MHRIHHIASRDNFPGCSLDGQCLLQFVGQELHPFELQMLGAAALPAAKRSRKLISSSLIASAKQWFALTPI
ncbi:hypothetical protein ASE04_06020 [Rhizobium sp. Root708]|nr:hypothetical protein ASE04_06020 [Rhizobium sp. Root708]